MKLKMILAAALFVFVGAQQPSYAMPSEWVPYKFGGCTGRFDNGGWGGVYSRIFKSVADVDDIEQAFRAHVKAEFPSFDTSTGNCEIRARATEDEAKKERNRLMALKPSNQASNRNQTSTFTY